MLDPLRNLVRTRGAGTILLHHSGKGNGSYRGSSAIGASAELGFTLARQNDDQDRDRRSLSCWKCRPAPKPWTTWLRLGAESGMVLVDRADPPGAEPSGQGPVMGSLKPRVLASLTDRPQTRAGIARVVDRDPKDRSVGRILDDLAAEGLAEKSGGKWVAGGWQGGNPPSAVPLCHPGGPGIRSMDGLNQLGRERPLSPCRCDRPLTAPDGGELRCSRCGRPAGAGAG